ncbi:MAG: glycerol uptake facilitator protein [Cellvibrionaceae bacterium]|jgi:glycerol uptake facilitator protein
MFIDGFLGELLGTMLLVLLGDGVVANVLLKKSKAEGAGWMVIASGWAFAVLVGVLMSFALGGPGNINPAVSIGLAIGGWLTWTQVIYFVIAQLIGAFLGAVLLWLHFLSHWGATDDPGLILASFSTGPAIRETMPNYISEIIATFVLTLGVAITFTGGAIDPYLGAFIVAGVVWGVGLSLGGTTGYAINPARDLMPRLAHAILPIAGKGDSDWGYAMVPVLGPITGGVLAGILVFTLGI